VKIKKYEKYFLNCFEAVQVYMSSEKLMGKEAIRVIKDSSVKDVDEPTLLIPGFASDLGGRYHRNLLISSK